MGDLTKRVIDRLKRAHSTDDLAGCIWIAADLLRKFRSPSYKSGSAEVELEEIIADEQIQIQKALIEALDRNSDPKFVSQIINALSCAGDPTLKELYVDYLARYLMQLKGSNGVVYAALLALDELDENVYEKNPDGSTSQSVMDVDKNIRQAHQFLEKLGVIIPW